MCAMLGCAALAAATQAGTGGWTVSHLPLPSGADPFTESVVADPQDPKIVYAAGGDLGLFESRDGGRTWRVLTRFVPCCARAFAVDPKRSETIYSGFYGYRGASLSKSADGGRTWKRADKGLSGRADLIVIDPRNPQTLYAAGTAGLFKSTNAGRDWRPDSAGLPSGFSPNALAIDAKHSRTLYAGMGDGPSILSKSVFKSTNGGRTWQALDLAGVVEALAIDPRHPQVLYAATRTALLKSTDGGAHWVALTGLSYCCNPNTSFVYTITVSRLDSRTVYAGTSGGGVFRSDDGGRTWSSFSEGLPPGFLQANAMDIHALAISSDGKRIYAAANAGVFRRSL